MSLISGNLVLALGLVPIIAIAGTYISRDKGSDANSKEEETRKTFKRNNKKNNGNWVKTGRTGNGLYYYNRMKKKMENKRHSQRQR